MDTQVLKSEQSEQMFTKKKQKQKKTKKKTEDPQEIEGSSFPDRSCFTVHVCVVLHLHIEGVLSKRALAGEG